MFSILLFLEVYLFNKILPKAFLQFERFYQLASRNSLKLIVLYSLYVIVLDNRCTNLSIAIVLVQTAKMPTRFNSNLSYDTHSRTCYTQFK